jgi:chemotaxis protein methyltransferase CheR
MSRGAEPSLDQVLRFRTSLSRRLGLELDDGKLPALGELLHRRIESTGGTPESYLATIESSTPSREELRSLAPELTVSETYFFRNVDQFHALRELVVPMRARARAEARAPRRLRILSAGCASGEEVYSLAIWLRDHAMATGVDLQIEGIDVNPAALARAAQGRYSPWSFRETPAEVQDRCFRREGRDLAVEAALRSSVTFAERNLVDPDETFWQPAVFDVVFCRNVIMYFPAATARAVIARLAHSLVPGGFLFMGHAETLRGRSREFHLRHTHGTFYYQKRGEGETDEVDPGLLASDLALALPRRTEAAPGSYPVSAGGMPAWIEAIQRATDRIASLSAPPRLDPGAGGAEEHEVDRGWATGLPPSSPPMDTAPASRARTPAWNLASTVALIGQERFDEARASLTTAPPDVADAADVLLVRAVLLTHGGDLDAAEKVCARVLELDEMSAGAHYLTALCREHAGDRRAAADHDQVAAYLDPAFALPRLHLGLLARRAGEMDQARRSLDDALGLLQREDPSRLVLFAGGFSRDALVTLCRTELSSCGGAPS